MLQDDEFQQLVLTDERVKTLGFRPQKEILTNHLLPYSEELDEESNKFFAQVKTNFAKSVILREMKPACVVWSSRLIKYIRIYGLKFGKEDHIAFIKLAYELVLIPELEPCKVQKFATLFVMLTKKKHLISPEELVLPWRPLYDLGKRLFEKNSTNIGMFHYISPKRSGNQETSMLDMVRKIISGYGLDDILGLFGVAPPADEFPTSLGSTYMSVVRCAKPYFEVSATKEILEMILPGVMPWGNDSETNESYIFLPVGLPPENAAQGHELWFNELMTIYDTCHNTQSGDPGIFILFANLAKNNPGAVDWTPYVPKIFMRFLHTLNLPVSYKDMQHCRHASLDVKHVAKWIVWTINPDGVVLKHLKSFLAGVESYLHSANAGRWSFKLRDLLKKLAGEFLYRVRFEREKKFLKSWGNKTPEGYKLRDEDITEFVMIVLEPTFQAVYSRSGSLDISVALQNLATLRPAIVIPPLIDKLRTSLTSLTEPHRVTAAMSAVAAVARPMLRGADADYPEGPTHVVPLLMAVLPGLDPNDIKKTIVTLHFILMFSCMVTYIDCSSAHEHWPDLTEEEQITCELTAQFEDFILVLLDKLFAFIESSVQEHVRLESKDSDSLKSRTDMAMETGISCAVCSVLTQCSPQIFKVALRKFKAFATETTYETNVSGSMIGALLKVFARINPEATLAAFLPPLCLDLGELLASDEALHDENPPRELVYRLVLFSEVVSCDGTVLLKYMDQILPVLDRALKLHATYALSPACDALANILSCLSAIDLKEWKCSTKDYGAVPEKWLPIREWGNGCSLNDVKFQWHVPSAEEAACAQMLIDRYVKSEVDRLQQWLGDERPMCRERRLRSLNIINSAFFCSKFLPPPNEEPVLVLESEVPATNIPFTNGVKHQVFLDGENMRVAMTRLLLKVQAKMLTEKTEDPRGLDILLQVWERVLLMKNLRGGSALETKLRSYGALERAFDGKGGVGGKSNVKGAARLRMVLADAVRLQEESRLDLSCDAGITPSVLQGLNALYDLSINSYTTIRRQAQVCLYKMLTNYPYSYRALIPKLVELLGSIGNDDEGHARHKGALYILLGPKMGPLLAKQDWSVIRVLWPAILKAPLSEKLSIHRLERAFIDVLFRSFPTINTRLTLTDGSIEAAKRLLTEDELRDPTFVQQLAKSEEVEMATSDSVEQLYLELINDLVDIAESSVQWWRLELAMQMLIFSASLQTQYPPRAVRLFTKCLLHENFVVRRLAQRLVYFALKQRKRKLNKIKVDPYQVAGVEKPETHIPGYRKDLEWAVWSKDKVITTDEEWDKPWLRNYTYGYYSWPKKIEVAAPISQQNYAWDTNPEDMEEGARYIYEFFTDEENVTKLVKFFTTEEKKGKDKFLGMRSGMFRFVFAHYGLRVTKRFIDEAIECASKSEESKQRFAAEVACAALRAPRYWRREDAMALQREAMKIVTNGLTAVIPETQEDWGTAMATAVDKMDPVRNGQVLERLLQLCSPPPSAESAPDKETSFVASARLYVFQGVLAALSWRAAPLAAELLKRLEAANFIQHPYENVRATVGSVLMMIFNLEVMFPGGEICLAPSLQRFLDSVQPRLAALYDEKGDIVIKSVASISTPCSSSQVAPQTGFAMMQQFRPVLHAHRDRTHAHTDPQTAPPSGSETELQLREMEEDSPLETELPERLQAALHFTGEAVAPAHAPHERAVNLLTTVLSGCMGIVVRGVNTNLETHFKLVPLACALASRGSTRPHEELPRAAGGFLAALAQVHYRGDSFDRVLNVLEEMANGRSWWARLACLDFAIPLLFYGLPMLCDRPERAVRAEAFALKLMRDSRVEVRQSAAKVLTGLMHCRALPDEDKTLQSLIRSARSKESSERHRGVLGLCAYMSSRPYGLGPRLGDVLTELARHTNAPDPIPATIRTALADFKRTHQDDWPKHREQLTEDELDLLADLTSPPSYCA
ncbi:unnamed protein product [Pieris brassicae]|uniref:Proteasome activator complex subunit 4 C-terminal domain-containing protein n=1 Tax=Pieris brassicae TaxID=7116 RepID=A0A9P0TNH9_PIEBR|nr:unnamed protein product [Pieris brassicae]